jgi:hypothetical protein
MPVIGDVDKFMAGGATVTALYAGAVKVWPLAPPPPPAVHAQDDAQSRMMIWDEYWAGIDTQPRPIEVVCSPAFRVLPTTSRITVIDAASAQHYVTWSKNGPVVTAGQWIQVADTGGYWIARNGSVVGVEYYLTPARP